MMSDSRVGLDEKLKRQKSPFKKSNFYQARFQCKNKVGTQKLLSNEDKIKLSKEKNCSKKCLVPSQG